MRTLFLFVLVFGTVSGRATEISTECPAMNQERGNPKASLKVVKAKRPTKSGASKQ